MTPEEVRYAVMVELESSWATATGVAWPNKNFVVPDDGSWIRPHIVLGEVTMGELGDEGCSLRNGTLMVSVFTKADEGTRGNLLYAGRIETMFRRQIIGGVIYDEPYTREVGPDGSGWYHTIVTVPFWAWVGE